MRLHLAVLVAVTSVLTVVSPVAAGPRHSTTLAHTAAGDWAFVQHELYELSMRAFVASTAIGDRWYDWSSDGCSAPLVGDTGFSFNFRDPCRRHDFGYRNLRLLERRYGRGSTHWNGITYWNGANRRRVDQQFLADMKAHCRTRSFLLRASCFAWAETYYAVVRVAGGP